jgi:hypothetical protein
MAEAAPARTGVTSVVIKVPSTGSPVPLNQSIPIDATVYFDATGPATSYIWTWDATSTLNNVFAPESNNYVPGTIGVQGPLTFNTSVVAVGQTISFQANPAAPSDAKEHDAKDVAMGVKGTISITSSTSGQ